MVFVYNHMEIIFLKGIQMSNHLKNVRARRSLPSLKARTSVEGKEYYKKLIAFGVLICVVALLTHRLHLGSYFALDHLQAQSASLLNAVQDHYFFSVIVYLVVYAGLIACALPVVAPMTILGGYLFGIVHGVIYAAIGASAGATIYFLLVRYVFARTVQEGFAPQLSAFHEKMNRYGASYLISLQLLTIIPYFVINTLAALADVPLVTFIWTTVLGGFPLHVIYAVAGQELGTLTSIRDILKPSIIVLLLMMACMALLPMVIQYIRAIPRTGERKS